MGFPKLGKWVSKKKPVVDHEMELERLKCWQELHASATAVDAHLTKAGTSRDVLPQIDKALLSWKDASCKFNAWRQKFTSSSRKQERLLAEAAAPEKKAADAPQQGNEEKRLIDAAAANRDRHVRQREAMLRLQIDVERRQPHALAAIDAHCQIANRRGAGSRGR